LGWYHTSFYTYLLATTSGTKLLWSTSSWVSLHFIDLLFAFCWYKPNQSSNYPSLLPRTMETSIGTIPYLFLYIFISSHKWFQTSFKHQLFPITQLAWLDFRQVSTRAVNHPTMAHYTLQTWKLVLGRYHTYSYTYLSELQVVPNFFQEPAPPYHSTYCWTWFSTS
jgi:hypothetical protein